jgi:hypothetical protein
MIRVAIDEHSCGRVVCSCLHKMAQTPALCLRRKLCIVQRVTNHQHRTRTTMLSAILRAPFARPLFLSSVSRLARPAAIASPSLLLEARRTFLTTAPVAATEAKTTKAPKAQPKKASKAKVTPKAKVVKAAKPKERKGTCVQQVYGVVHS